MKSLISRFLTTALVLLSLCLSGTAWAESAEAFVKARQAELTEILRKGDTPDTKRQIGAVFDGMLDYDKLARESLAGEWDGLNEAQRTEFQGLLKQLVQRAYKKNLRKTLDYAVTFKGEDDAKDGALVQTVARHKTDKRKEPISVDYVLHKVEGKWRVYDIVTEGSSLVRNYQNQFRRIINKKGFSELIARMRKKVEED